MTDKFKNIPIPVAAIGQNQRLPYDPSQEVKRTCINCSSEFFKQAYRVGYVSKMASGNLTGKNILTGYPVYVCMECGTELKAEQNEAPAKQ